MIQERGHPQREKGQLLIHIKMRIFYLFICFIIITGQYACSPFLNLSKKIDAVRNYDSIRLAYPFFKGLRKKEEKAGNLNFINYKFDTLYILEAWLTEGSLRSGIIWNKRGEANYTYSGDKKITEVLLADDQQFRRDLEMTDSLNVSHFLNKYNKKTGSYSLYFFNKLVIKNRKITIAGFDFHY